MDENDQARERVMKKLDPRQLKVLRLRGAIWAVVIGLPLLGIEAGFAGPSPLPPFLLVALALLVAGLAIIVFPARRYRGWGYADEEEELHVAHGLLVRTRTVVPHGRVTHIDIAQGPIERRYGLATLILHTAGTRGATVSLPGLERGEADRLRDHVRARIRQDLV
jgi:uncharacterized protein